MEAERAKLEKQLEGVHLRKKRSMLRAFDKSNGLVKPSEEEIAKATAGGSDDEGFSDFDDFDDDEDFGDDDDLCSEEDPLERALSRMAMEAAKGGPGLLKDHGAAATGPAGKGAAAEEEEEDEEDFDDDEEEEGQESR